MPEDKYCLLLQPSTSSGKKKKNKNKKKRKKVAASIVENTGSMSLHVYVAPPTEKLQAVSLPSETSPVSPPPPQSPGPPQARRPTDSPAPPVASSKTSSCGELSARARESLRWEGVLDEPQAEEKRLELYRANRRQRYSEKGTLC